MYTKKIAFNTIATIVTITSSYNYTIEKTTEEATEKAAYKK